MLCWPLASFAQALFEPFDSIEAELVDISRDGSTVLLTDGSIWKPGKGIVHQYPNDGERVYRGLAPDGDYVAFSTWDEYRPTPRQSMLLEVAHLGYPDGTEEQLMQWIPPDSPLVFGSHNIWPLWKRYFEYYTVVTAEGSFSYWPELYEGSEDYGSALNEFAEVPAITADGKTLYGADRDGRLLVWSRQTGLEQRSESLGNIRPRAASHDGGYIAGSYRPEGASEERYWLYRPEVGVVELPSAGAPASFASSYISRDGSLVQMGSFYWVDGVFHTFAEALATAGVTADVDSASRLFISDDATVLATDQWYLRLSADASAPAITPLHLAFGQARFARYEGISGSSLEQLHAAPSFPDEPDSVETHPGFELSGGGENFGVCAWAWLVPDTTGEYTFWLASDDAGVLSLSADGDSTGATVIARVPGHTRPREYDRYADQRSEAIFLEAGRPYYIEAQMKQGWSDVNLSVAWQGPGFGRQVIPGRVLGLPFADAGTVQHPIFRQGSATLARYEAIPGTSLDALFASPRFPESPDDVVELASLVGDPLTFSTRLDGANFGSYAWTWFMPESSGEHHFWLSSDDQGELWLSENAVPADAQPIASVPGHTRFETFGWYPEQRSAPINLEAGRPYFLSTIVKQGWSDAHVSVQVTHPSGRTELLDASDMTTTPGNAAWEGGVPPVDSLETGGMAVARYDGLAGSTLSHLRGADAFPSQPAVLTTADAFLYQPAVTNSGLFGWAWLIPEVSGDYRFWLIPDDQGELYLSTSADPAAAVRIASAESWVAGGELDKFASQRSSWITLEAGKAYYIAGLVKQEWGSARLEVRWEGPGIDRAVIPGSVLALPASSTAPAAE